MTDTLHTESDTVSSVAAALLQRQQERAGHVNGTGNPATDPIKADDVLPPDDGPDDDVEVDDGQPGSEGLETQADDQGEGEEEHDGDDVGEDQPNDLITIVQDGEEVEVKIDELMDGRKFNVKVDGDEQAVDFSELRDGYMRQADHTRKTMDLAAQKRELEASREAVLEQTRAEAGERLASLKTSTEAVESLFADEPNWADLAKKLQPEQYQQQRANWDHVKKQIAEQKAKIAKDQEAVEADEVKRVQAVLEDNRKALPGIIPEWKNQQRATDDIAKIEAYLTDRGIGDIGTVITNALAENPAWVAVFRDAALLGAAKAAPEKLTTKRRTTKTRVLKSSGTPSRSAEQEGESARSQVLARRAQETGTVTDVAAMLLERSRQKKAAARR